MTIARTMITPAALGYRDGLAESVLKLERTGTQSDETRLLLDEVSTHTEALLKVSRQLSSALDMGSSADRLTALGNVRECADALEALLPSDEWPLPSYTALMFMT